MCGTGFAIAFEPNALASGLVVSIARSCKNPRLAPAAQVANNTSTKRERVSHLPLSRLTRLRFVLVFPMPPGQLTATPCRFARPDWWDGCRQGPGRSWDLEVRTRRKFD